MSAYFELALELDEELFVLPTHTSIQLDSETPEAAGVILQLATGTELILEELLEVEELTEDTLDLLEDIELNVIELDTLDLMEAGVELAPPPPQPDSTNTIDKTTIFIFILLHPL